MEAGRQVFEDPIPPVPENTKWFSAGELTFGVEYRLLDTEILKQAYPDNPPQASIDDSGVSLHVVDSVDGAEYLRFDCFTESPHYHYVMPGKEYQQWVPYDNVANGPVLDWALRSLRTRLDPMLREAGGAQVADRCDYSAISGVLELVESQARSVTGVAEDPHTG